MNEKIKELLEEIMLVASKDERRRLSDNTFLITSLELETLHSSAKQALSHITALLAKIEGLEKEKQGETKSQLEIRLAKRDDVIIALMGYIHPDLKDSAKNNAIKIIGESEFNKIMEEK